MAEVFGVQPLGNFGVAFVTHANVQTGIRAIEGRIEVHGVVAFLSVFQENGQVSKPHVAFLDVVLAGNRAQVGHLNVLRQAKGDFVNVRQLVSFGVHTPKVRIAFHKPGRCVVGGNSPPGRHRWHFGIERPTVLELEQVHPSVKALVRGHCVDFFFRRVLGQELLEIMRRAVPATPALERAACREPGADAGAPGQCIDKVGVRFGELEGDGKVVNLFHDARLAIDRHFGEGRGHDFRVRVDILKPEDKVVRSKRRAIRPLGAFTQVNRYRLAVVAYIPVFGQRGHNFVAGVVKVQDFVLRVDAVAVLVVRRPGEATPPRAAVLANLMHWLDDQQVFGIGQALLDRWQVTGGHHIGQRRRFAKRGRVLAGV